MTTIEKKLSQKELLDSKNADLQKALNLSQKKLLDTLNTFDFKDIKVKEKKSSDKKSRNDMYHYQFLFNKYKNLDYSKFTDADFKKNDKSLRTKLRHKRNSFANNIILYAQNKDLVNLQKEIKDFNSFYKETYVLNDYSLKSISDTNSDSDTKILLNMMLDIILKLK
jgi:hypothetical protein